MFDCKCLFADSADTPVAIALRKGRLKTFGTIRHVCFQTTSFNFIYAAWRCRAYQQLRRHFAHDGVGRGR